MRCVAAVLLLSALAARSAAASGDCAEAESPSGRSSSLALLQHPGSKGAVSKAVGEEEDQRYTRLVENMEKILAQVWTSQRSGGSKQAPGDPDEFEEGLGETSQKSSSLLQEGPERRRRTTDWQASSACNILIFQDVDWARSSGWRSDAVRNGECQAVVDYLDNGVSSGVFMASAGCKLTAYDASGCSGTSVEIVDARNESRAKVRLLNDFPDTIGWNDQISSFQCAC
ncbi:unnamed protein product [Symbiodinium natans]|uniref:Uncharacterized protein n=1 Tax=Symbiodinium natans TaxID=878477 RepID=A0A812I4B3_9DINO|nr:unnamed protein product [Symbiodinium natans]